jgi:hypothetical protein
LAIIKEIRRADIPLIPYCDNPQSAESLFEQHYWQCDAEGIRGPNRAQKGNS